jgi:AAA15 family ATPase/GTPase
VKYLPLFHHFKAIYQFLKHIIFLVKIVANAPLNIIKQNKKKSKAQICMNINGSKINFPKILPVQNITTFLIS